MYNLPQIQLHDNLGGNIPFWVVLTDYDALYGRYAWTEQQFVYGGQDSFTDMVGGRFGTLLANYAWEANQNLAKVGSYALIQRAYWQATEVGGVYAGDTYLIVYTLPVITPDTPVVGFDDNSIVYINNNLFETNTNFQYDVTTNTFTNIGISYFDIDNYTFTVINSDTTIKYIFIDDSVTKVYIWEETLIVNNGYVFIDISTGDQIFQIWNQTDIYFKVDDSTNIISIWNNTVLIDYGNVLIDIGFGDQLFQIWNQTDIYIKVDDSTNIISIWNSTVFIDNGSVKIDISTGDQIFYIWNQTDYYIKIDDSTQIINLWGDTIIIEEGDVKIDILVGQLFQIWDQTDIFFKIDQSTGDILIWNSFVHINELYFKFVYSSVTFFWVDASDYTILLGHPTKTVSDTTGYVYWNIVNGRPTGTPVSKTGYRPAIWDYDANRFWWWTGSAWILPCCWVIIKITFADTPKVVKYNELIWVDTSGGPVALELPAPIQNGEIQFKKATTDANAITLSSPISGSIVGPTSITNEGQTYTARSDGTDWYVDETCVCVPAGTNAGDILAWNGTDAWEVLPISSTDGYLLSADSGETLGLKWVAPCCYEPFTVTYDADATFTPTFTGTVKVECWGAGGDSDWDANASGGGGAGAYSRINSYSVTASSNYTVNVAPDSSEDTYFVDAGTVMAKSGANCSISPTGASGGASGSCVGDVSYSGGDGANASGGSGGGGGGSATSTATGGNASGTTGGTGEAAGATGGASTVSGTNGTGPGGAASGAGDSAPPGPATGGAGRVIITRVT